MTRTRVNKSDMKSTGVASGLALIADGAGDIVHGYSTPATHTHTESQITDLSHDAIKLQSREISSTAPSSGQALAWNSLQWVPSGVIGAGGDTDTKKVKVVSTDTTEDYLENKVRAGTSITITTVSGTGNAFLRVDATGSGYDTKQAKVSSNDTTEGYLEDKIVAGDNVTVTVLNEGGNEQLEVSSTASGGAGSSTFLGLTDVPSSYTGQAGRYVVVNSTATALEFVPSGTIPAPKTARVHLDTNRPYSADGWNNLNWGTAGGPAEDFDTAAFFWNTGGSDWYREVLFCPEDGYYQIRARLTLVSGLESGQLFHMSIRKNGSAAYLADAYISPTYSGYSSSLEITTMAYLTKADPGASDNEDSVNIGFERLYESGRSFTFVLASGYNKSYFEISKLSNIIVASGASSAGSPVTAKVYSSTGSGIAASGVWGSLYWNTESWDTNSFWSAGTSVGYKLIAPTSGWYDVHAQVSWAANAYGTRSIRLMKNNAFELATTNTQAFSIDSRPITTQLSDVVYLLQNDFISIQGMSNSPTSQTTYGGDNDTFITIAKLA